MVVLGHIDHGKSSLLEAIKDFKITVKEAGGITQHIGAYQVEVPLKEEPKSRESKANRGILRSAQDDFATRKITFIDTPGHEAFSQMRSRGAKVADIAILVIDASEGAKAQTKEAISHIKKAGVPVILALNKMDKPEADPERVKRELSKEDFVVESMGGKIPSAEISAKTKKGIPELLDLILLVAEMERFSAPVEVPASGVVVESYLDNLRGATATLLITQGTLKQGDIIGTPSTFTKVKTIENFQKNPIEKAFPSEPVIIFGFDEVPRVGEEFMTFSDLEEAKASQQKMKEQPIKIMEIAEDQRVLNLILKTDVAGSTEAIEGILRDLPQEKVVLRILKSEVGGINESDLKLAASSRLTVLGFRVKVDPIAKRIAERENIRIMLFEIIYDLVEGVRKLMEKIVAPQELRHDLGKVKVLAKFLAEKNRQIIGGRIIEGEVKKGSLIEVFRNEEKIGQGRMINLQRNKKNIDLLGKGEECGILFEGEVKIEEGDILQIYTEEKIKGKL